LAGLLVQFATFFVVMVASAPGDWRPLPDSVNSAAGLDAGQDLRRASPGNRSKNGWESVLEH
jgi:hypothetical protein